MSSPCNCCGQFPCAAPVIKSQHRAASKSKCGYPGYLGETNKRYFTRVTSDVYTLNDDFTFASISCARNRVGSWDFLYTEHTDEVTCIADATICTLDGSLDDTTDCPGGSDSHTTYSTCGEISLSDFFTVTALSVGNGCVTGHPGNVTVTDPPDYTTTTRTDYSYKIFSCGANPNVSINRQRTTVATVSSEYTTAQLITEVVAALPAFSGGFISGSPSSFKDLGSTELSYSIREAEYQWTHMPTGSCYLKIWRREKFTPEVGSVIYTDLDPYEWIGTPGPLGNLCFDVRPYTDPANEITTPTYTLEIPETDGEKVIEWKYSCLRDYEPSWSGEGDLPNGYPFAAAFECFEIGGCEPEEPEEEP